MPAPTPHYQLLSDQELFSLSQHDDTRAYETLYHRHWPRLIDAAYKRLYSRQKAEDMIQDLFVNIYQRRQQIELTASLHSYLNQALKYRILNEYRNNHVRTTFQNSVFFKPECKNDFADPVETKELNQRIEGALENLPEKCKHAFLLSRRANLSNKQIGDQMRISVSTVEKHIGKALRSLRESVREYQLS